MGDIHYGSDDCSLSHLQECVAEIADTPHCYWIGMGDAIDFARTTARRYLRAYAGDESSLRPLDKIAKDAERDLYHRYLKKIAPRCLGMIEGNHFWSDERGVTTGQRLSEMLDCPYLFDMGALTLHVETAGKTLKSFRAIAAHGDFGGNCTTPGGDLNAIVTRGGAWLADFSFYAHSHRKLDYSQPVLTWPTKGEFEIQEVPHIYVRTGGYLRGYRECDERGRYVEQKALKPSELGHVSVKVQFGQEHGGRVKYRVKCTK